VSAGQALNGTRCGNCGDPMPFDEWARGKRRCDECANEALMAQRPAATFVRGPGTSPRTQAAASHAQQERLVDDLPDSLFDEIIAALERESAGTPLIAPPKPLLQDIISDIGIGTSPREWQYALWGFAAGFAGNVALAKYAQMSSGAPMSDFIGPLLFGGVVAGGAAALIGWAVAKLRER
jgi:hypothetical protein